MTSQDQEFVISFIDEGGEVLRERFQELGYLLMRNYVPQQRCDDLLRTLLAQTTPHVTMDPGAPHPRDYAYIHSAEARETFRKALNQPR